MDQDTINIENALQPPFKHDEKSTFEACGVDEKSFLARIDKLNEKPGTKFSKHCENLEKMLTKREISMLYIQVKVTSQKMEMLMKLIKMKDDLKTLMED